MRFLDDEHANKRGWGKAFPLTDIGDGCFLINPNLVGTKGPGSLVDTGCNYDGWLTSQLFEQWTNQVTWPADGEARYPNGVLGGESYPFILHLRRLDPGLPLYLGGDLHMQANGIGLHFLARHLVTLDFPKQTMYLKRTSVESLSPQASKAAVGFLKNLKKKGQLPGWSKEDKGAIYLEAFSYPDPRSVILTLLKRGDSSVYRYTVTRTSDSGLWRLQGARRANQKGDTLEEYSLP
jgi:hypothetical protein